MHYFARFIRMMIQRAGYDVVPLGAIENRDQQIESWTRNYARLQAEYEALLNAGWEAARAGWIQQNAEEFVWLLGKIAGARSILEVGGFAGASLRGMAEVAAPGALLRCIDDGRHGTITKLYETTNNLRAAGFDAAFFKGDSHHPGALNWARMFAPYDVVFIDGDHDEPGVTQDWESYGCLGSIVAFHDISAPEHAVSALWSRIKAQGYRTEEMIVPYATPVLGRMGVGIVHCNA